jgi:RNA polymerase sigma-70 factor (ECF subfamily)
VVLSESPAFRQLIWFDPVNMCELVGLFLSFRGQGQQQLWHHPLSRVHNHLSAKTELLVPQTPLSSMDTQTPVKDPPTPDQTLLVLLAQTGDRTALEQLLRAAYTPLRRYIRGLVSADLADDILQETSLQIFRKLPFLREPCVFRPWTFRIASRIAFSHLKHARRWQPLDDAPIEHLTTLHPSFGEPTDEAFSTLLDHVSAASRAVLLLHYQHDLSLEESAAILEIPIGTAKSRLHYGVNTLRKHLTAERKPA